MGVEHAWRLGGGREGRASPVNRGVPLDHALVPFRGQSSVEYAVKENLALHQGGHGSFEALPFVDATIHLAEVLFAPVHSVGVVLASRRVAVVVQWRLAKPLDDGLALSLQQVAHCHVDLLLVLCHRVAGGCGGAGAELW